MPIPVTPAYLTGTNMDFYIPPTIQSDYKKYLYTDVPNATRTFVLLHDWYDQFKAEYVPEEMRAEMFAINWKSKIGTSDASVNFYTHLDVVIKKGDYVIDEGDNEIYMLNWAIGKDINAQHTQAAKCNLMLKVERAVEEKWNPDGTLAQAAGTETVFDSIPAIMSEYAGRPDYAISYNTPGLMSDMLISGTVQWNPSTAKLRIHDEFTWGDFRYKVINVTRTEVTIDGSSGILGFNARRVSGEYDYER